MSTPAAPEVEADRALDRGFFGHPRGLSTLFFTEMWERFSYYGMRAILTLFMLAAVANGGLGFTKSQAATVYGIYTSMVYLLPVAGGWIADNFLGLRRAVFVGGVVIMTGHVCLAVHGLPFFFTGLACVVIGTGLLKPNIAGIVGRLYAPEDARRDAGFSIFYMGINLGAFLAPLVCGWLAQSPAFQEGLRDWGLDPARSWHFGFAAAAVGMFLGLVQYLATGRRLGEVGKLPATAASPEARARARRTLRKGVLGALALAGVLWILAASVPEKVGSGSISAVYAVVLFGSVVGFFVWLLGSSAWSPEQRRRLVVLLFLFLGSCVFWGVFEQAGSTLTVFADESTRNSVLGWSFASSWWQSVNAGLIVLLAPLFAWLWTRLGNFDPTSIVRFSVGLVFAGLGFAALVGGAAGAHGGARVSPGWLFACYLCHTIGELCLSPVGLSAMTRLAPDRIVGMMLGVWYASISVGSFLGGRVAGVYERFSLPVLFGAVAAGGGVVARAMVLRGGRARPRHGARTGGRRPT